MKQMLSTMMLWLRRAALLSFIVLVSGAIVAAIVLAMVDGISWFDNFEFLSDTTKFLSFEYWSNKDKDTSRSEIVRNLGLVLAAVIGICIAFWRLVLADKQQALAQRGHITDRINKAVENLGHKTTAIKLGGVHTLWRLIEEIPGRNEDARRSDVKMILDILTSFVRHNAKERVNYDKNGNLVLRVDVETAVQLLGDKSAPYRSIRPDYKLNLHEANLSGGKLDGCDFHNANLAFAKFNGANMHGAILANADVSGADFTNAKSMTEKQVDSAIWREDGPPRLPNNLIAPMRKPEGEE